jgi:hypothetical protein
MIKNKLQAFIILLPLLFLISCQANNNNKVKPTLPDETESKSAKSIKGETISTSENIDAANIYLENSGSMYGYVSGGGDFSSVISTIAADCDLLFSKVNYNLVNGKLTNLGTNLTSFLKPVSSVSAMKVGDPTTSDLNSIFEKILEKAGNGNISILISDGIYSVNGTGLISKLKTQSTVTRNKFVKRLKVENLTTFLIKYESKFKGNYYPAKGSQIKLDQNRPYYVWVIGEADLIKSKFKEGYFQNQPGFVDIVKFVKLNSGDVSCQYVMHNIKGSARVGNDKLVLNNADVNARREFAFSLAFDFSKVPYNEEYFRNDNVYSNDKGYTVTEISASTDLKPVAQVGLDTEKFKHVVTFSKKGPPWGTMEVVVKNIVPNWIAETNTDDDSIIIDNTSQTYGFKYLIDGIANGYSYVKKTEDIAKFQININK